MSTIADNHAASEMLGLWEPKRTLTLESARRHSRRIKFLRQVLLILAACLVVLLVFQFATQQKSFIVDDNPGESVKMINPRYSGRTADGLPYRLTADSAVRLTQNASEVGLVKPVLHFLRERGMEDSMVVADQGTYDDVTQILNLRTAVDLTTDDGYHCVTTHARIFNRDKRIEGDEPIRCTGGFGVVTGQTYEILEDYSVFVFKDGMTGQIEPSEESSDGNVVSTSDEIQP